jgi:pimeloyl-ACP methyl ester carboxylesterase
MATTRSVEINDIRMHVEIDGTGKPLVLLHGFTGVGSDWKYIFETPPDGFQTITPDLRGHGRSTNPAEAFTHRQSALDAFALLDHLGIRQCSAIGMSTGAKTLLHMATQQPDRLRSMVLVSATPYFPQQARDLFAQFTLDDVTEVAWALLRQRHVQSDGQIRMLYELGRQFSHSTDDMTFTASDLSAIGARTLIVHGDRDPYYPVSVAFEMYTAIRRSWLWVVPNGGHGPIFGAASRSFADSSMAFLRGEWEPVEPTE